MKVLEQARAVAESNLEADNLASQMSQCVTRAATSLSRQPPLIGGAHFRSCSVKTIMETLSFDSLYWEKHLPGMQDSDLDTKLHLIASLIIFLSVTVQQTLLFIFSSDIPAVKARASRFMGYFSTTKNEDLRFPPSTLYQLWHSRWPQARPHLHAMIEPCAHEIALEESNWIIKDPTFQIRISSLTVKGIRELLRPETLVEKFKNAAPFMFGLMHTFSASPNKYRRYRRRGVEPDDWDDEPAMEEDSVGEEEGSSEGKDWWKGYDGFSRNPIFVSNKASHMRS